MNMQKYIFTVVFFPGLKLHSTPVVINPVLEAFKTLRFKTAWKIFVLCKRTNWIAHFYGHGLSRDSNDLKTGH